MTTIGALAGGGAHRVDDIENEWATAERMKDFGESAAHPFALPRGEDHRVGPVTHVLASIRARRSRASGRRPYDGRDADLDARHRRPDLRRRFRRRRPRDAARARSRRGAPELDVRGTAAGRPAPCLRARPPRLRSLAARWSALDDRRQRRPADPGDHPAFARTDRAHGQLDGRPARDRGGSAASRASSTRSCSWTRRCRRRVAGFRRGSTACRERSSPRRSCLDGVPGGSAARWRRSDPTAWCAKPCGLVSARPEPGSSRR